MYAMFDLAVYKERNNVYAKRLEACEANLSHVGQSKFVQIHGNAIM